MSLFLLYCVTSLSLCGAVQYYVTPTPMNPACPPGQPCHTLDQYAQNAADFFKCQDNITLLFFDGIHNLTNQSLEISSTHTVIFVRYNNTEQPNGSMDAVLHVLCHCSIIFKNVSVVRFERIAVRSRSFYESRQTVQLINAQNISYYQVRMDNSMTEVLVTQSFLQTIFSAKNLSLLHSPFILNIAAQNVTAGIQFYNTAFQRGYIKVRAKDTGAKLAFHILKCELLKSIRIPFDLQTGNKTIVDIEIAQTNIDRAKHNGRKYGMLKVYTGARNYLYLLIVGSNIISGRYGLLIQTRTTSTHNISIYNTTITQQSHSGIKIDALNSTVFVIIESCYISRGSHNVIAASGTKINLEICLTNITAFNGNGLSVSIQKQSILTMSISKSNISKNNETGLAVVAKMRSKQNIHVYGTVITDNNIGGIIVYSDANTVWSRVELRNCTFEGNKLIQKVNRPANLAAGFSHWAQNTSAAQLFLKNVRFVENHDFNSLSIILQLFYSNNVQIEDCWFEGNKGTPIQAYFSKFYFRGSLVFLNNNVHTGGGIVLLYSRMYLHNNTDITFINNTAKITGGAIFVQRFSPAFNNKRNHFCFFGVPTSKRHPLNIRVNFYNNSARYGGERYIWSRV